MGMRRPSYSIILESSNLHDKMRFSKNMKSLTGLFLILCLFIQAQAQFAFDEEGIFVANPDYSLDRIE